MKCAKNNKAVSRNFTSCEYNHTHKIKRGNGCEHYKQCEDKQWFDGWLERDKMCTKKGDTSLPKYEEVQIDGENWDEEIEPFYSEKYCGPIPEIKNK